MPKTVRTETHFQQVPLENAMEALLKELTAFIRGDAQWWDDAARHIEDVASKLADNEKSKWQLVSAVIKRERNSTETW